MPNALILKEGVVDVEKCVYVTLYLAVTSSQVYQQKNSPTSSVHVGGRIAGKFYLDWHKVLHRAPVCHAGSLHDKWRMSSNAKWGLRTGTAQGRIQSNKRNSGKCQKRTIYPGQYIMNKKFTQTLETVVFTHHPCSVLVIAIADSPIWEVLTDFGLFCILWRKMAWSS